MASNDTDAVQAAVLHKLTVHELQPDGLRFWMRHKHGTPETLWAECPRMEWLMWIAERCGVSEYRLGAVRQAVEDALEERARFAMKLEKADSPRQRTALAGAAITRDCITWLEVVNTPRFRRAVEAETAARDVLRGLERAREVA